MRPERSTIFRRLTKVGIGAAVSIAMLLPMGATATAAEGDGGKSGGASASEGYDSVATAKPINVNTTVSGTSLANWRDVDWYKFTIPSDGVVQIKFSNQQAEDDGGYVQWGVTLFQGSDLSRIDGYGFHATQANHSGNRVGLPAGTYYVQIYAHKVAGMQYKLNVGYTKTSSWETEFNNDSATADQLGVNRTISGTSTANWGDNDWYKLSISKPGVLQIQLTNELAEDKSGYSHWGVSLLNANDLSNTLDGHDFSASSASHSGTKIGVPAGTYYVHVYPGTVTGLQYNLKVAYTQTSSWETEPNNSFDTADPISLDRTVSGTSRANYNGDNDWFRFTLPTKDNLTLKFTNQQVSDSPNGYKHWNVRLYRASDISSSIRDDSFSTNSAGSTVSWPGLAAGAYYVQVYPGDVAGLQYNLTIQTSPKIKSIAPVSVTTNAGTAPKMPSTVTATYTNGAKKTVKVTWPHIYSGQYAKAGSFTVTGTVSGTNVKARATVRVTAKPAVKRVPVYRVYNRNSGLHHYTVSKAESDMLVRLGWRDENRGGSAFVTVSKDTPGARPVYREYNRRSGNHNWTLNKKEHDMLVRLGWRDEGVAWYTSPTGRDVYRLYNPKPYHKPANGRGNGGGEHVYTTSWAEYRAVVAAGWRGEGIAWKSL